MTGHFEVLVDVFRNKRDLYVSRDRDSTASFCQRTYPISVGRSQEYYPISVGRSINILQPTSNDLKNISQKRLEFTEETATQGQTQMERLSVINT